MYILAILNQSESRNNLVSDGAMDPVHLLAHSSGEFTWSGGHSNVQFDPTLFPSEHPMVSSSSGTIGLKNPIMTHKYDSDVTHVHDSLIHFGV